MTRAGNDQISEKNIPLLKVVKGVGNNYFKYLHKNPIFHLQNPENPKKPPLLKPKHGGVDLGETDAIFRQVIKQLVEA